MLSLVLYSVSFLSFSLLLLPAPLLLVLCVQLCFAGGTKEKLSFFKEVQTTGFGCCSGSSLTRC